MIKNRDSYWDNLKLVLIFLVVLGHFLIPIPKKGQFIAVIYYWIYLFHMPAFVFVSGYFSKSYVQKERKEYKLTGLLSIYCIFTVSLWIIQLLFSRHFNPMVLLSNSMAPWYMAAMFFWYLLIPYVSCLSFSVSFPVSLILALAVGLYSECGNFFMLSRTIVFFPFFLAGYHFDGNIIKQTKSWMKILGVFVLLLAAFALLFYPERLTLLLKVIYADRSYSKLGFSALSGTVYRSIWLLFSTIMISSIMLIIPNRRFSLTYIGERTLAIYVIHRLCRELVQFLGLYRFFGNTSTFLLCIVLSVLIILIASAKPITSFFNYFFHMDFLMNHSQSDRRIK